MYQRSISYRLPGTIVFFVHMYRIELDFNIYIYIYYMHTSKYIYINPTIIANKQRRFLILFGVDTQMITLCLSLVGGQEKSSIAYLGPFIL